MCGVGCCYTGYEQEAKNSAKETPQEVREENWCGEE